MLAVQTCSEDDGLVTVKCGHHIGRIVDIITLIVEGHSDNAFTYTGDVYMLGTLAKVTHLTG